MFGECSACPLDYLHFSKMSEDEIHLKQWAVTCRITLINVIKKPETFMQIFFLLRQYLIAAQKVNFFKQSKTHWDLISV
jgi:hypothetical protein